MLRRHPLPRSTPPAPSDTTSAAPIRMPGTRPLGNPQSNAPGRTGHKCPFPRRGNAGTTSFCSGISPVDASRAPRPGRRPGLPRPGRRQRRPPACRRPGTGRRRRTPHSRAPATRPRTARPSPPGFGTVSRRRRPLARSAKPTRCPRRVLRRPEQQRRVHLGRRRRTEPAAVVHLRSRTTHGRDPPRASDVQASFRVQGSRGPGPPPCSCSAPPECAQPVKPRTGVARLTYSFRSTTPTMRHQARRAARRPAPRPRRVRPARSSSDRQRTTVSRRARSRSGTRSKGDAITQSGSSRDRPPE